MRASTALAVACLAALLATGPALAQSPPAPGTVRALTQPQDDYPDVSPDGTRIVFQSNRSGTWQLWLMNRDGTGLRRLTTEGANDRTPAWSPDGTKIVFSSDRAGDPPAPAGSKLEPRNIFVLDVASGAAARLIAGGAQDIHPKWSRDGRRIVFNRVYPGGDGADIMVADADGGNPARVALDKGWNTYASLTPDGGRIVYRGTTKEPQGENSDVFTVAPDGSDRRRLSVGPAFDGWPALSPDGATIAFASRRSGERFHIFLMPLAGGEARQVTSGDQHYTQPAWSPDGRHLAAYRWTQDRAGEVGHIVWIDL